MKMTIIDGILKKCILEGNETSVNLPETVEEIGEDAFADNPDKQIRRISFPDSVRRFHPSAFNGLEKLEIVTAYTYGENETAQIMDVMVNGNPEFEMLNIPDIRHLIILKGTRGDTFYLHQWAGYDRLRTNGDAFVRDIKYPENIYVFAGADLHCSHLDEYGEKPDKVCTQSLNVYYGRNEGSQKHPFDWYTANLIGAKKIRFINLALRGTDMEKSWMDVAYPPLISNLKQTELRKAVMKLKLGHEEYSWQWIPVITEEGPLGTSDLELTEEIVLPEGLVSLTNEINRCIALKKMIIPATVTSIANSFRECPSLEVIAVDAKADADMRIDEKSFYRCPKLKKVQLYIQDPVTAVRTVIKEIRKEDWLRNHMISQLLLDLQRGYPDIHFYTDEDEMWKAYDRRREIISGYESEYPKIIGWWNIVTVNGKYSWYCNSEHMLVERIDECFDEIDCDMNQEEFTDLMWKYHEAKRRNYDLEKTYKGIGKLNPYLITDYDKNLSRQDLIIYDIDRRLDGTYVISDAEKDVLTRCRRLITVLRRIKDFN